MWQQAFRDQIKADKKLLPSYKVCLLDLADQLYSNTWTAQRGCSSRDIGKRCACSKDTAYRAIKAAVTPDTSLKSLESLAIQTFMLRLSPPRLRQGCLT